MYHGPCDGERATHDDARRGHHEVGCSQRSRRPRHDYSGGRDYPLGHQGRNRVSALRVMCSAWGVDRREKSSGKWKDRTLTTLEVDLRKSVCSAAAQWTPKPIGPHQPCGQQDRTASEPKQHNEPTDSERCRQRGVPEHASASSSSATLPPDDRNAAGNADLLGRPRNERSPSDPGPPNKAGAANAHPRQATGSAGAASARHEPRI